MKSLFLIVFVSTSWLLSGCASIVTGHDQSLSVRAEQDGKEISGASCKLLNDKGVWFVNTPGSVTVHTSYDDLDVYCERPGMDPGLLTVISTTKGMAFGNILFGGVPGAVIDT